MTVPPPPSAPPPGSPGHGRQPNGFDPRSVHKLDWAILGIGAIVFIFSFFGYYTFSTGFGRFSFSVSWSGWHFGSGAVLGWFAMVLAVAAAASLAIQLFAPSISLPMKPQLLTLALFAASTLLYILGLFAMSIPFGNHGFSYWVSLVLAAGGLVVSLMRVQQHGEQLPGALSKLPNIGGTRA